MKRSLQLGVVGLALGLLPTTTAGGADERRLATSQPRSAPPLSVTMRHALDRSHAGLHEVRMVDGSARVHLDGRFRAAIAVRVEPTGAVTACVTSADEAERFLNGTSKDAEREADR